jgi:hypothetical protein
MTLKKLLAAVLLFASPAFSLPAEAQHDFSSSSYNDIANCTTSTCLQQMPSSGGIPVNESKDQIIIKTDTKPLLCFKNNSGYNCNPTNNTYNPLDF